MQSNHVNGDKPENESSGGGGVWQLTLWQTSINGAAI